MGTVSQLYDRTRPLADRIESEEQAIEIARSLSGEFARRASERDINRIMPSAELDIVSQSGLLGITIPAEYGGLDISNIILAEIVALLAEGDASVASVVHTHFEVLEALRAGAVEDQREFFFARAMAGDRFGQAEGGFILTPDGAGYRISGRAAGAAAVVFADWLAAYTTDSASRPVISVLPREADGIQLIDDWDSFGMRTRGNGTVILHAARVDGRALIAHHKTLARPSATMAVATLLDAAVALGIARSAFAATSTVVLQHETQARSETRIQHIGKLAVGVETAAATVERAGKKVDIAQVDTLPGTVAEAEAATAVAALVSSRIALETTNALFEFTGSAATKIGLNLDRHWRDARAHAPVDKSETWHRVIGTHHLNRNTPS